jgi:hypothetical protein
VSENATIIYFQHNVSAFDVAHNSLTFTKHNLILHVDFPPQLQIFGFLSFLKKIEEFDPFNTKLRTFVY